MARILFLCPRILYPLTDGAKLRMYNTAEILSRDHTIDLLIVENRPADVEAINHLREKFERVHLFEFANFRFYLNAARSLVSSDPVRAKHSYFSRVESWLDDKEPEYDLLYAYLPRMGAYLIGRETPTIVDLGDSYSLNYRRRGTLAGPVTGTPYRFEARRMARYERRLIEESDHALITTEVDKNSIDPEGQYDCFTVYTNGVNQRVLNAATTAPDSTNAPTLVFVGKMDYEPNVRAVVSFTKELLPSVRDAHPGVKFQIVGATPTRKVRQLGTKPGVHVTGFVDDPIDYVSEADIVVAPIRTGSGIQNKILEGMALSRPVVTTPIGAEGIRATPGEQFEVVPFGPEFTQAVVKLLDSPERRVKLGKCAEQYIKSNHRWSEVEPQMLTPVESLL